jgi:2'-5' RNA ligase
VKPNWFIGLPVPTGGWLAPLLRSAPSSVRPFQPADVHLTVAFFGPVEEPAARRGWDALAMHRSPPLEIVLGGLAPMGNPRRPSALSVVVTEGHGPLVALIAALREPACRAAGAKQDDRPPLPHITVARPLRNATDAERREAIEWARSRRAVDARVALDRLVLLTWAPDRRERQFREVAERPLAG